MLVLGVGNAMRGDDGVGPEVATRVARLDLPGLEVASETEPLALLDHLRQKPRHDVVVVVDATAPGPHPGRVRVLEVAAQPLVRPGRPLGSHGLGVVDAVELARSLGLLPPRLTVIGIEALSDRLGAGLSDPVGERVEEVVRLVLQALTATVPSD
jgi:hydrogenase maturation protease